MVYRIYRRTLAACCLAVGVGCSSAPATSPSGRLVSVELSETALSLGRTESVSVQALATYANGSKEDVTDVAFWSTSPESPVHVARGSVTGKSIGRGNVVATFGGLSATASVTVRRRTEVGGAVTVSCEPTARILAGLQAHLDDAVIGRVDVGSDHSAERTMRLSFSLWREGFSRRPRLEGVGPAFWLFVGRQSGVCPHVRCRPSPGARYPRRGHERGLVDALPVGARGCHSEFRRVFLAVGDSRIH